MIRDIEYDDVDACFEILKLNWSETQANEFRQASRHSYYGANYYVCELDKKVVGFAGMMKSYLMTGIWDFIWINIHPEYQKQHIGSQLTWFRIHEAQRLGASAINLMTQHPNTEFFKKFGFKHIHEYSGAGWTLMTKQLKAVQL